MDRPPHQRWSPRTAPVVCSFLVLLEGETLPYCLHVGRVLSRAEMTLHEVQVYLDREGASDLVAELVMKSTLSPNVFMVGVTFVHLVE